MQRTYALLMDIPEGKRAGYYAQVVKGLAGKAPVLDRDKEMLIFATEKERQAAHEVMSQYAIPYEELELLLLPSPLQLRPTFDDFGFVTRLENAYVYQDLASVGRLVPAEGGRPSEPEQAYLQLEEHLLAVSTKELPYFVIETQHEELAERIAAAYGCSVQWLQPQG